MAQRHRHDEPGSWHHVMNRGIARRTVFENRQDMRAFLAAIACEVRRGLIEVHAYSILPTHFHLLVCSPQGRLGEAMKRALNRYVRRFNRLRRRDGSLVRGRYRSRPVQSLRYRRVVVRYIDGNALRAGLADAPEAYEYGSARWLVWGRTPPWLSTWWIDSQLTPMPATRAPTYRRVFAPATGALARLVERRLSRPPVPVDPMDDLVGMAPRRVFQLMKKRTALADETKPGITLCDAESIEETIPPFLTLEGSEQRRLPGGNARDLREVVAIALLRDLGGMTFAEVARRIDRCATFCQRAYAAHVLALVEDAPYGRLCSELAQAASERCQQDR